MTKQVKLPKRRVVPTPRLLMADAYTVGGNIFQSERAKEKSTYYATFRRELYLINQHLYRKGDNRIVFYGLGRIIERLFYDPITHEEIDEAMEFLKNAKVTSKGLTNYNCPEELWRIVVDEYNGRPPISIMAMPEGSVVYPNEPVLQCMSTAPDHQKMGELAAWFESKLLQVWATSERATQDRHWLEYLIDMVIEIDPNNEQILLDASSMLTDFGDRAGACMMESEEIPMGGLLSFMGTDTFSAAYQAWQESGKLEPTGISVLALAHRNVQAYEFEGDCYRAIYDAMEDNEIGSMVADCYDFKNAVETFLLPLALESKSTGNGKVVVGRPDSGDPEEQVLWMCRLAMKNGLYTERAIVDAHGNTRHWKFGTFLKFIEGDSMTFEVQKAIMKAMMAEGFAPYGWGLFGVGGGLRNNLKRDNLSAKYAINAVGKNDIGVIKTSEVVEKSSLPGPLKVLRTQEAIQNGETITFLNSPGENAMVSYYDGSNIWEPFGPGMEDTFLKAKARLNEQWGKMPKDLANRFPATTEVLDERDRLLAKYSPNKVEERSFGHLV
jgi:nicotinic acid phosphoribosyltransferase